MNKLRAAITDSIAHLSFWLGLLGVIQASTGFLQSWMANWPKTFGALMVIVSVSVFVLNWTRRCTLTQKARPAFELYHDDGTVS